MRTQAPASWLNAAGEGLLAITTSDCLIHLSINGIVNDDLIPVARQSRGRPNTSSLWLSASVLALPIADENASI